MGNCCRKGKTSCDRFHHIWYRLTCGCCGCNCYSNCGCGYDNNQEAEDEDSEEGVVYSEDVPDDEVSEDAEDEFHTAVQIHTSAIKEHA